MPKNKEFVRVTHRVPRFRQDSTFMQAHETMVDFIKGSTSGSFMDLVGAGIFGFTQNLELDPERDMIYSEEEDEEDDYNEQKQTQKLKPHPQLKELDDEEAVEVKQSLEVEQKRKTKSVKNKRKKMRKKEKKRQEKEDGDQNVLPVEEQGKSDCSENEELIEENNIDKSTHNLSDKLHTEDTNNKVIKEENTVLLNKEKDNPPENIDLKKPTTCITEFVPEKKTKNKSKKKNRIEKAAVKEKSVKSETVKVETKETENTEIKQEEKQNENREETVDPTIDEYAKKSKEMAAIGNCLAAKEQYEMAIKCFTEAIKLNPREYKLFGNRSFCFEKMQQYEEALCDAEVSLSLQPDWIKGLFRKGKALCGLKKYYEASLAYSDVLKLDSTSQEATMELKRSQTLHLMEMGFTWTQCSNALKRHSTLEAALEALFNGECGASPEEKGACQLDFVPQFRADQSAQDEWENVRLPTKSKPQTKEKVQPPAPVSKNQGKPEVFPVWVGSLAPTVNYLTLQQVFSRAGKVVSIKTVLEHHCAFVNFTRKEDSARAIQLLNGLVLEGCPLSVRYPSRIPPGIGASKHALIDPLTPPSVEKECFFWRTTGCTRSDCTFIHTPQNRGIDRERVSNKLTHYN